MPRLIPVSRESLSAKRRVLFALDTRSQIPIFAFLLAETVDRDLGMAM
jgi:hypothetical protein